MDGAVAWCLGEQVAREATMGLRGVSASPKCVLDTSQRFKRKDTRWATQGGSNAMKLRYTLFPCSVLLYRYLTRSRSSPARRHPCTAATSLTVARHGPDTSLRLDIHSPSPVSQFRDLQELTSMIYGSFKRYELYNFCAIVLVLSLSGEKRRFDAMNSSSKHS